MPLGLRSLLPLAVLLAACDDPPTIPTTGNGELHQGTFVYACTSPADAECGTPILPLGIAVDADFDLRFQPTAAATATLEPNASFFTTDATGKLHATRAGYGLVLVTNPNGAVIDFVNLHISTIASLTIEGAAPPIQMGETRTLSAKAFDAANEPLAGTLTLEWESEDPSVATMDGATLKAVASGTARIRVIAGAATGAIDVVVGS